MPATGDPYGGVVIDALRRLLADPPDLPVAAGLPAVADAVRTAGAVVVQAPPGSGKTTLVPPCVAVGAGGRVVVTQPRRIAVRAAARRLAGLLGEPVGETVGYAVRGETRTGPATRVEVVTPGVLVRRLQRDPDLPGVAAVVLDEVHERQVEADLALALLVDVRRHLRDDLVLVAMSATVEAERTAALLDGAAVVTVPGALHPVARHWAPPPPGVLARDDRGVTPAFLDHVAATVRLALVGPGPAGDVLVFLPGAGEVAQVARRLADADAEVEVVELHGRLDARAQDRALTAGPRRRVVVATAVAESSLTVPGVRTVVDAGLARRPQTDHRRGLAGLVTVRVSRAAADQRAGRAGREAAGAVHRCWSEADHAHLAAHPEPEVATADLTAFALDLAVWGSPDGAGLALLDPPPAPAMDAASATLRAIGAVDDDGAVTDRGRAIARVPADPRLARALLDGAAVVGARRAAEVVALLAEDVRAPGGDLVAALREARRNDRQWRAAVRRLEPLAGGAAAERLTDDQAVGLVVALVHPERIARRRPGGLAYATVGGTGAVLARGSALTGTSWLAVADVERRRGQHDATIRAAVPIDEETALDAAAALWHEEDVVTWARGRTTARRVTRLGGIELTSTPVGDPDPVAVAAAVADALRREGLGVLRWTDAAIGLRARLAFVHRTLGDPWPDVSDAALLDRASEWLDGTDPRRLDVTRALRRLVPGSAAARLDELAPERVTVPSGAAVRVDYAGDQPVLAVRLQEVFGWAAAPRLAGGRVPLLLHLLSPARRPAAVTADLTSFWASGYPAVRAELRGRYPKHAWPDDPTTAPPTRGTGRRG